MVKQLLCALAACASAGIAHAQSYPAKPITLVVPFPPGGIDNIVRLVTQKTSETLGQTVVVENKPGASGIIAAQAVRQAAADGYTLLLGHTGTHAVNQTLYAKLPYDPERDFEPITTLFSVSHVLVVPPTSSAQSVADLVSLARKSTSGLNFASQGIGTGGHLLGEMLKSRSKAAFSHVAYKGTAPAQSDVMAGRIDAYFDGLVTSLPHIKAGKLKALAVATKTRSPYLPHVPTMAESGYPGIELDFWFGVYAPSGTPANVTSRLRAALTAAMQHPDIVAKLSQLALHIFTTTPGEMKDLAATDAARLGEVVRESGAKAD